MTTLTVTTDVSDRAKYLAHFLGYEAGTIDGADLQSKVREAASILTLQDAELAYLRFRVALAEGNLG